MVVVASIAVESYLIICLVWIYYNILIDITVDSEMENNKWPICIVNCIILGSFALNRYMGIVGFFLLSVYELAVIKTSVVMRYWVSDHYWTEKEIVQFK